MEFGLGLVLSFTDNATSGIQSAVSSLGQLTQVAENASSALTNIASLSAFSSIANTFGNSMLSMGSSIVGMFNQAINKVNSVGQTLNYAKISFDKLYGDGMGAGVLAQIQEYAEKSVFAFEDLIPVVRMLKANGIDAFQSIASSTGQSNQMLMDYASDLAAFNPQMRNAYGRGVQAAMGALNEYIAEGNKRLLKSGASLDITQLLGEGVGKTIEERSRQVADLLEKLNMVGMTTGLVGTPMQKLSNMGDVVFNLFGKIANSGIYDEFTKLLSIFADWMFTITDSELSQMAQTIADSFVSIMRPLEGIITKITELAEGFKNLLINQPKLAKFITTIVATVGALLLLGGVAMKALASFGYLSLMITTMGHSFSVIKTAMLGGIKSIMASLIPLTLAIGLMYLAWKNDFAGIRTNVTWFVGQVQTSFNTAKNAVSGDVNTLIEAMNKLNVKSNFFDGLTLAIMKVMVLFDALKEGWSDYTLSEDTFLKAKELGILPLIEAIFDLKYRFDNFVEGFAQGWQKISDAVANALKNIQGITGGTIFDDLFNGITQFFQALSNNDADAWKRFGEICAFVSSAVVALGVAFKVFGFISAVAKGIIGIFTTVAKVFNTVVGVIDLFKFIIMESFTTISSMISSAIGVIIGVISSISAPILAIAGVIIALIGSIVVYAVTHWEDFKNKVLTIWTTIKDQTSKTWNFIKTLFSTAFAIISKEAGKVVSAFSGVIKKVQELFGIISSSPIFSMLIGAISKVGETLVNLLVPAIVSATESFFSRFRMILAVVTYIFTAVFSVISDTLTSIFTVISGILDIIIGVFTLDLNRIFQGVSTIFNLIYSKVQTVLNSILNTAKTVWNNVKTTVENIMSNLATNIQTKWDGIKNSITNAINTARDAVGNAIEKMKSFFNFEWKLPDLKLPHFSATGSFSLTPPSVPKFDVQWYREGGVFNQPSVIGVGESGREAVMPLERNTEWITQLAGIISSEMREFTPISRAPISSPVSTGDTYYNTSSGDTSSITRSTDNSVHFERGAIQLNVTNATPEEAEKFANYLIEFIGRKKQISDMLAYNT